MTRDDARVSVARSGASTHTIDFHRENAMYDMYPEWGPDQHRETRQEDSALRSAQSGLDLRDHGGQRPDDN